MYFCKLFDGARHDSGEPSAVGRAVIAHYGEERSSTATQDAGVLRFADLPKVIDLYRRFSGRARLAFGVGTISPTTSATRRADLIKMIR